MKAVRSLFLFFGLVETFSTAARAQWTVFDPANYANALNEFHQLQHTYTTALQTRNQVIAAYNLAYQMSRMPQNLAARYKSEFARWTNLSAANSFGNTAAWIDALNTGSASLATQAYAKAVVRVQPYPAAIYSSLDPNTQATIANQYATSELAEGTTSTTLSTLGSIRSNAEAFASKLANLESDTYSTDASQQTQNALLGKINSAAMLQIHSQQDTNQMLAASVQQQLIAQKQQIDAQNRAINQSIYFHENFPSTMQSVTTGVSNAIHSISLSPRGK